MLYVRRVDIFYGNQKIASHQRVCGNNKWQLDPMHYLELLRQRPLAFQSARPIRQWRARWPVSLEKLLERFCQSQGATHGIKEFIGVLGLFGEHEHQEVIAAVEEAVRAGVSSRQAVEHLLLRGSCTQHGASPMPLGAWPTLPPPDLSVYAQMGTVP